ncbi:unnamed protein product, partial [Rotaria magnacalcarata]
MPPYPSIIGCRFLQSIEDKVKQ